MDEQDLLELKQDIEKAKTKVNQLEGQRKGLLEQLKEDWGCSSVEEAEKKLSKLEAGAEKLDKKLQKGIQKLEEKYEFE